MASSLSEKDARTYTEREMVLAKRQAFVDGAICWVGLERGRSHRDPPFSVADIQKDAARKFPTPKIERQRTPRDPHPGFTQQWRVVEGFVQWRDPDFNTLWKSLEPGEYTAGPPRDIREVTPKRIALWASLLETPTELVDEGSESDQEGSR